MITCSTVHFIVAVIGLITTADARRYRCTCERYDEVDHRDGKKTPAIHCVCDEPFLYYKAINRAGLSYDAPGAYICYQMRDDPSNCELELTWGDVKAALRRIADQEAQMMARLYLN